MAAVADYRPLASAEHKLKKTADTLNIALTPNPDILAEVAARADAPFCVGFAAESRDLDAYAEGKRRNKRLPMLVGNLVSDGMGGDDNTVILYRRRRPPPAAARRQGRGGARHRRPPRGPAAGPGGAERNCNDRPVAACAGRRQGEPKCTEST